MAKILVLHGPNLNMLGIREPEVYGTTTLKEIDEQIKLFADSVGHKLASFQSNAEHELIDRIQLAKTKNIDFIIINPGAFTHTSVAIRDAFLSVSIPFIEVHLSNVFAREEFRKQSYLSDIAVAVVSGMGAFGYEVALQAAEQFLEKAELDAEKREEETL
ncbi:MAG: type II 3-dehydroquinate dehydratase [Gammaproteobacteria bacterium]|nr:MAG: type II 3-dehydroquinate dehydratase [Gammaproteobacteria bacterium]